MTVESTPQSAILNQVPSAESVYTDAKEHLDQKWNLKPFTHVQNATEKFDFIELQALDFGTYQSGSSPSAVASRQRLAAQLNYSLKTHGFFYITNHGIEERTLQRLDSISRALHDIPDEEKLAHRSSGVTSDDDVKTAGAERSGGFKPRKYWGMANGVRDNIEFYNWLHVVQDEARFDQPIPEVGRAYSNEITNYFRFIHNSVLYRLTILCDIVLGLPEGTFFERYFKVVQGDIPASGGGFGRLMWYYGQDEETNKKTGNTWLRGHSDSSGFTFIASQPMISLQIRNYETKEWQFLNHVPGALIVNVGDAVEFITGGYWRSTIHRVVNPPESQQNHLRHSIIYFCKPSWNSFIQPEDLDSPVLKKLGVVSPPEWEKITFGQWDTEKSRLFGKAKVNNLSGDAPQPVLIHGRYAERWVPTINHQTLTSSSS